MTLSTWSLPVNRSLVLCYLEIAKISHKNTIPFATLANLIDTGADSDFKQDPGVYCVGLTILPRTLYSAS